MLPAHSPDWTVKVVPAAGVASEREVVQAASTPRIPNAPGRRVFTEATDVDNWIFPSSRILLMLLSLVVLLRIMVLPQSVRTLASRPRRILLETDHYFYLIFGALSARVT